ncbi:hypothetical protein CDD80_2524 [Ophiocordyceps camponoti-rufipedis]|uniref:Uncharacterized protein n=1 Tax=Ophiocordyceps camponoti-rufipedis TaxID=2004952 RepID=A0A2C5Z084_9HYPO|nr:hypothetical protein CDD80_2524 [Ophiocordyceps camponoti-rufipedis]
MWSPAHGWIEPFNTRLVCWRGRDAVFITIVRIAAAVLAFLTATCSVAAESRTQEIIEQKIEHFVQELGKIPLMPEQRKLFISILDTYFEILKATTPKQIEAVAKIYAGIDRIYGVSDEKYPGHMKKLDNMIKAFEDTQSTEQKGLNSIVDYLSDKFDDAATAEQKRLSSGMDNLMDRLDITFADLKAAEKARRHNGPDCAFELDRSDLNKFAAFNGTAETNSLWFANGCVAAVDCIADFDYIGCCDKFGSVAHWQDSRPQLQGDALKTSMKNCETGRFEAYDCLERETVEERIECVRKVAVSDPRQDTPEVAKIFDPGDDKLEVFNEVLSIRN